MLLFCCSGFTECVKWLIANRAKIDVVDNNGRTPLDIAEVKSAAYLLLWFSCSASCLASHVDVLLASHAILQERVMKPVRTSAWEATCLLLLRIVLIQFVHLITNKN